MAGNILVWVALGILAGIIVVSILPDKKRYFWGTMLAGMVGAFVGGIVYSAFVIGAIASLIEPKAMLFAGLGAVILVGLIGLVEKADYDTFKKT